METNKQNGIIDQNNNISTNVKKSAVDYVKSYYAQLSVEKVKNFIAFCVANKLNPAKSEVYAIPNKQGELTPVLRYTTQLRKLEQMGIKYTVDYLPNLEAPTAIKVNFMGNKDLIITDSYVLFINEWKSGIGKQIFTSRIRAITQGIRECIPSFVDCYNEYEINEVLGQKVEAKESVEIKKELLGVLK